jgi:hypothetical protein
MSTRTHPHPRKSTPAAKPGLSQRTLLLGGGVLLVIIIVAWLILSNATNSTTSNPFVPEVVNAPFARFNTTLIDHGDMQMEEVVESVFEVRNTGDQVLTILSEPRVELVRGCCPPRAIVSQSTLQPGETATIRLRFTMHDMMGGPHEFRVHVPTNDPTQPMIPLTILSNWIE